MPSAITFLRRAFSAITNNKYAPWIAMAIYILIIFLTVIAPSLFISLNTSTNTLHDWRHIGREVFSFLLHQGLFITITWFVISKIIDPDTLVPLRTFTALYFFSLTAALLVTTLLAYTLFLFRAPPTILIEISGSTTQDIIHWSLFLSGILLAKRPLESKKI